MIAFSWLVFLFTSNMFFLSVPNSLMAPSALMLERAEKEFDEKVLIFPQLDKEILPFAFSTLFTKLVILLNESKTLCLLF